MCIFIIRDTKQEQYIIILAVKNYVIETDIE
jgi:hypothetical protein